MSRSSRTCVNVVAAILIIAFVTIFTGLFIRGGHVLLEQNITQQLSDAFHRALRPPSECTGPSTDVNTSTIATFASPALNIQQREDSHYMLEPWGVYMFRDVMFRRNEKEGKTCRYEDLRDAYGQCRLYVEEDPGPLYPEPNFWQSFGPDPGVECILVSTPWLPVKLADLSNSNRRIVTRRSVLTGANGQEWSGMMPGWDR